MASFCNRRDWRVADGAPPYLEQMPQRRFPPPWSIEETDARLIVRDANGQALAYVLS